MSFCAFEFAPLESNCLLQIKCENNLRKDHTNTSQRNHKYDRVDNWIGPH